MFLANGTSWGYLLNMRANSFYQYLWSKFLGFSLDLTGNLMEAENYALGEWLRRHLAAVWMSPKLIWADKIFSLFAISLFPFQPQVVASGGPSVPWEQGPKVQVAEGLVYNKVWQRWTEGWRSQGLKGVTAEDSREVMEDQRRHRGKGSRSNGKGEVEEGPVRGDLVFPKESSDDPIILSSIMSTRRRKTGLPWWCSG